MIQAPSLFIDAINDTECAYMLLVSLFLSLQVPLHLLTDSILDGLLFMKEINFRLLFSKFYLFVEIKARNESRYFCHAYDMCCSQFVFFF